MTVNVAPRFYTPAQVARLLNISLSTVYRRLEDGLIPGVRAGLKPWRIPMAEFNRRYFGGELEVIRRDVGGAGR